MQTLSQHGADGVADDFSNLEVEAVKVLQVVPRTGAQVRAVLLHKGAQNLRGNELAERRALTSDVAS